MINSNFPPLSSKHRRKFYLGHLYPTGAETSQHPSEWMSALKPSIRTGNPTKTLSALTSLPRGVGCAWPTDWHAF
jgi:hypothetical protein